MSSRVHHPNRRGNGIFMGCLVFLHRHDFLQICKKRKNKPDISHFWWLTTQETMNTFTFICSNERLCSEHVMTEENYRANHDNFTNNCLLKCKTWNSSKFRVFTAKLRNYSVQYEYYHVSFLGWELQSVQRRRWGINVCGLSGADHPHTAQVCATQRATQLSTLSSETSLAACCNPKPASTTKIHNTTAIVQQGSPLLLLDASICQSRVGQDALEKTVCNCVWNLRKWDCCFEHTIGKNWRVDGQIDKIFKTTAIPSKFSLPCREIHTKRNRSILQIYNLRITDDSVPCSQVGRRAV